MTKWSYEDCMIIKENSFIKGWEWFLDSYKETKPYYKSIIGISFFYCCFAYMFRAIPIWGHLISSFTVVFFHYAAYMSFKEKSLYIGFSKFYQNLKKSLNKKNIRTLFLFKLVSSLISFSIFSLIFVDDKFWPATILAGFLDVLSLNIVFHTTALICDFNQNTEDALFVSLQAIKKNFFAEMIFISWTVTIILSSSLPFMLGWFFTAPFFTYVNFSRFKSIYQNDITCPLISYEDDQAA